MNVAKSLSLVLVLAFLTSSCIETTEFVNASSPTENTWEAKASTPEVVDVGKAVAVDGKIYLIDGKANYQYDPATDTWAAKKPMPTPRYRFGIAVAKGKIFVIGGLISYSPTSTVSIICGLNEVYDPATNTWDTKQPLPTPRAWADANAVGDKIYLISGYFEMEPTGRVTSNEVYDVANDSWSEKKPMPYSTLDDTSAVCGGKIYIISGRTQIYDPTNDTWSQGTYLANVDNAAAVSTAGVNALRRIYVIGGADGKVLDLVQVYNPENDTWAYGERMPTARWSLATAVVNDKIYAIGGDSWYYAYHFNFLRNNEVYTPFGYGSPDPAYVYENTPPKLSLLSPQSQTYNETNVTLTFTMDKPISWAAYSLDGEANITTKGNATLTELSNGSHNVTVYANDTFGNIGASQTIDFTIALPSAKLQPSPIVTVAAISGATALIVVAGLLVYFKKYRRAV